LFLVRHLSWDPAAPDIVYEVISRDLEMHNNENLHSVSSREIDVIIGENMGLSGVRHHRFVYAGWKAMRCQAPRS
jgi:hypothetical protein